MAHAMFNSKHFLFQASYANIDRIKHIVIEDSRSEQLKFQEISFQEPSPQVKTQQLKFDGKNLITAKENKCLCMPAGGKTKKLGVQVQENLFFLYRPVQILE